MDLDAMITEAEAEKEEKKTRRVVVKRAARGGRGGGGGGGDDLRSRLRGSDDYHGGRRGGGDRWDHDRYDDRSRRGRPAGGRGRRDDYDGGDRPQAETLDGWTVSDRVDARTGKNFFAGKCEGCGVDTEVPFRPVVGGNPPVCLDCNTSLKDAQGGGGPDRGGRGGRGRRGDPYGPSPKMMMQQMQMMQMQMMAMAQHMQAGGGRGGRGGRVAAAAGAPAVDADPTSGPPTWEPPSPSRNPEWQRLARRGSGKRPPPTCPPRRASSSSRDRASTGTRASSRTFPRGTTTVTSTWERRDRSTLLEFVKVHNITGE